jgi:transcriptional regulator with XRE-family HTH domain
VATTTVPEAVYKFIGRRIEFLRTEKRLSQGELGRRLQHPLTRAAISNMESGRQRVLVHVLLEIADVLSVDPREILQGGSQDNSDPLTVIEAQLAAKGMDPTTTALVAKRLSGGAEES